MLPPFEYPLNSALPWRSARYIRCDGPSVATRSPGGTFFKVLQLLIQFYTVFYFASMFILSV